MSGKGAGMSRERIETGIGAFNLQEMEVTKKAGDNTPAFN